jgi:5-oxoprolinase (ATP-hydrolysing)
MKFVSRGDTTVVDAYLSPILRRYVAQVAGEMPGVPLFFMQSSGGLTDAHHFQGKDAILSGPAGGIVGMARTAQLAGMDRVIGFDMGGTSTDVSHYAGEFEREFETQVAGVRMRAPMMGIHTVAAGGGSVLGFDGARFRVGPAECGRQSRPRQLPARRPAGRDRCERDGGQDPAGAFSQVFGQAANEPLDADVVRAQFGALAVQTGRRCAGGSGPGLHPDRRAADGQCHQEDFGGPRLRRDALHPAVLRRRRRPARLPGGRRAGHGAGAGAPAGGRAERLWHGPGRPERDPRAGGGMHAGARGTGRASKPQLDALASTAQAPSWQRQQAGAGRRSRASPRACALRGHRFGPGGLPCTAHFARRPCSHTITAGIREPPTASALPFSCRARAWWWRRCRSRPCWPAMRPHGAAPRSAPAARGAAPQHRAHVHRGTSGGHDAALVVREDLRPGDVIPGPAIIAEKNATTVVEPGWEAS